MIFSETSFRNEVKNDIEKTSFRKRILRNYALSYSHCEQAKQYVRFASVLRKEVYFTSSLTRRGNPLVEMKCRVAAAPRDDEISPF